jgi:CheY-like chemotaxis protein
MHKASILFVDDEPGLITYYVLALQNEGYEVLTVSNVSEALKEFGRSHYDLVVLDMLMPPDRTNPEMSNAGINDAGLHLAVAIRRHSSNCKLIVLSTVFQPLVVNWFEEDPNARVLTKPSTDPFTLVKEVKLLLANKRPLPSIFIVHGHDKTAWLELKNYLQNRLGLPEPVILAEQKSGGRTVIEKLEHYTGTINAAFIIMTPDDVGEVADSTNPMNSRARQNVIFELGYFMGRLERKSSRIIILNKGPLEFPSDLLGIVHIDISNGIEAAGEEIRRELRPWI